MEEIERLNNTLRIKVEETKRWEIRCEELEGTIRGQMGQWEYKCQEVERQLMTERSQWELKQQQY